MSNDIISALMNAQTMPDDAEAQAMAKALRGQLNDANFLSLSTIDPVANFGRAQRQSTIGAAQERGRLNNARAKEKRDQEAEVNKEGRALKRAVLSTNQKATIDREAARKEAEERAALKSAETYWHPTQKDSVLNLERDKTGTYFDQAGNPVSPEMVATLVPYELGQNTDSRQSISAVKREDEMKTAEMTRLLDADFISKALSSDLIQAATGAFYDAPRLAAKFTGAAPEVQSLQNGLAQITATGAAPMLSTLGVNPTDKDLEVAFGTVPQESNEPQVWRDWYADRYAPRLMYMIQRDRPEIASTMEKQIKTTLAALDANIEKNAKTPLLTPPKMSNKNPSAENNGVDDLLEKYL